MRSKHLESLVWGPRGGVKFPFRHHQGKGPANSGIVTLVERRSRFALLGRLPGTRDSKTVTAVLAEMISTLPAAVGFQLPEWMLSGRSPLPVVFDVNYKPYDTALLLQATGSGCDVVRGSEMLWTQGAGQFELWTGRTAPYGMMKRVVLDNCLPSGDEEKKE